MPYAAAVAGFKKHIRGVIKDMRIDGRKHQRLRAINAILPSYRNGCHIFYLAGAPVKTRDFISSRAVNDIGVERIGRDVSIFDHSDGVPVAKCNLAIIAASRSTNRAALLL